HAHGTFKAPDRFLRQPRTSIDVAPAAPCDIRIWVERDRPVSHFDFAFTIADHVRRDYSSHCQRVRIIVVGAQCQAEKPKCFLAVGLRNGGKAPKEISPVTETCNSRDHAKSKVQLQGSVS